MAGKTVGLLVVHGIGEQQPGDTSRKLITGLRMACGGDVEYSERSESALHRQPDPLPPPVEVTIRGLEMTLVIYEVYWADLMAGHKAAGSFQVHQLLALPWLRRQNRERGLYGDSPPQIMPEEESLLLLYVVSTCAYYGYYGARQVANLAGMVAHTCLAALFLLLVPTVTVSRLVGSIRSLKRAVAAYQDAIGRLVNWDRRRSVARATAGRHPVDVLLDGYVGDIMTYVNSLGRQFLAANVRDWDAGAAVLQRFHARMQQASAECDEVHVLAHSLGSVVAYHGITGYGLPSAAEHVIHASEPLAKLQGFYTFGSPLSKFGYFWPRLVGYRPTRLIISNGEPSRVSCPGNVIECEWLNFYNPLDLVSGKLAPPPGFLPPTNIRVLESGLVAAHVRYERNAEFLGTIVRRLCGNEVELKKVTIGRVSGFAKSLAESLGGLGGFTFLVAVGAVTQVGVLWLLARGAGELVGTFGSVATAVQVTNWTWAGGLVLSLAFTAGAGLRLAKIQAFNWALWREMGELNASSRPPTVAGV